MDEIGYDSNIIQEAAEFILHRRRQKEVNQYIIKDSIVIIDYVVEFGINTATSFIDPIVLGSTLIPISSRAFITKYREVSLKLLYLLELLAE